VDDDRSNTRDAVCDWLRADGWFQGLLVHLHLFHQPQQRSNALWDVMVGPWGEPVVSDWTTLWVQLSGIKRFSSVLHFLHQWDHLKADPEHEYSDLSHCSAFLFLYLCFCKINATLPFPQLLHPATTNTNSCLWSQKISETLLATEKQAAAVTSSKSL